MLIAFGTKENLIALLSRVMIFASTFRTFPLIISERNHPKYSYNSTSLSLLRYLLYPLADFLHVQTTSIKTWFKHNSLLPSSRVSVIPNIIPQTLLILNATIVLILTILLSLIFFLLATSLTKKDSISCSTTSLSYRRD